MDTRKKNLLLAALIGIFHDADVRDAVATRLFPVLEYRAAA